MATQHRPRLRRAALALAGILMAVAAIVVFAVGDGGDGSGEPTGPIPEAGSKFGESQDSDRPTTLLQALAPLLASEEARDAAQLPLDRAAAQVLVVGFEGREPSKDLSDRIASEDWGGLYVTDANFSSADALAGLVRSARRAAKGAGHVAPLVMADPSLLPIGPTPQVEIGAGGTQDEVRADSERAGKRLRDAGIDVVLAPSADLGVGGGPAEDRAFSDDPAQVTSLTRAAIQGYDKGGVVASPGRFPGEGAASQDPLEGPATVGLSLEELIARDVRPFAASVPLAEAMQMSAALYAAWDGVTPASILSEAVALLRTRLGFEKAIVSADLISVTAATGESVGRAAVEALRAGCDVLLVPGGSEQAAVLKAIVDAVEQRKLPRSRLDQAVARAAALREAAAGAAG